MKLEHVAINVPDARALANFFVTNFGMRIVLGSDTSPFVHFVTDDAGGMLEIYSNPAAPIPDYTTIHVRTLHLAFLSDDIESDRAKLIAAGAEADDEIETTPAGDKLAFFRAPQGVPFQLVQRAKPLT